MQPNHIYHIPHALDVQDIHQGFEYCNIYEIVIARLDKIHPVVSGNKLYKLKHFIAATLAGKKKGLITMGGAWSNHLAATAVAAADHGIESIGLVRGEINDPNNAVLEICRANGMKLIAIERDQFTENSSQIKAMLSSYPHFYFIPMGGNDSLGEKGCTEILSSIPHAETYTHIFCAIGTGTTFRGIAASAAAEQTVIGVPVLKIQKSEEAAFIQLHTQATGDCTKQVLFGYARKGYGRSDEALLSFIQAFYQKTGIPTDMVYTGKLMMALNELLKNNLLPENSRALVIHTGGLLGNRSLKNDFFHWV